MKFWSKIATEVRYLIGLNQLDPLPFRKLVSSYSAGAAVSDLRAGLNVALLAFPQGMAYAAIAGLPIEYGIYCSAVAAVVGAFFAGSRFVMLGPTNATSVMMFAAFLTLGVAAEDRMGYVPLLVVMSGFFLVVGALLGVANLIQFVSRSVVAGYITAAAAYIIVNQARKVAGIEFEIPKGSTLLDVIGKTVSHFGEIHWATVSLAAVTAILYLLLTRKFPKLPNVAITMVAMSGAAVALNAAIEKFGWGEGVVMLEAIDPWNWQFTGPEFSGAMISKLAGASLVIAFLSVLEGASIGKSLAARAGERLNTNQEVLAMGMANVGSGFFNGMPASGSLTRSQLNFDSGASTQLSGLYSGIMVAAGAFAFGSFTKYIPTAVLGVLVIAIGLSLINRHVIRVVLKTTRSDAAVFIATFAAALLVRLDIAIVMGAALSILLYLRKASVPELIEYGQDDEGQFTPIEGKEHRTHAEVSIVHVEGGLFFGAADLFRDQMRRVVEDPNLKVVVLKMRNAYHLDATSVLALEELIRWMDENDRILLVSEVRKDTVRIFKNSGLTDVIGRDNIFVDNLSNPTLPTAKALRRAMKLIGDVETRVSIYVKKEDG